MSLPNYEHRTPTDLKDFDVIALEDSVAILTEQAEAIILMMQTQFISKDSQVETKASIDDSLANDKQA